MRRHRARAWLFGAIAVAAAVRLLFSAAHHRALPSSLAASSSFRDRRIDPPTKRSRVSAAEDPHEEPEGEEDPFPFRYEPTSEAEALWLGLSLYDDYDEGGGAAALIRDSAGDADALVAAATAPPPGDKVEGEVLCLGDMPCEAMRLALESLSGLRLVVVKDRLSPCRDDERRTWRRGGRPPRKDAPRPPRCADWARRGQCVAKPRDSLRRCARTCGFCDPKGGWGDDGEEGGGGKQGRPPGLARRFLSFVFGRRGHKGGGGDADANGPSASSSSSSSSSGSSSDSKKKNMEESRPCQDLVSACPLMARAGRCSLVDNSPNELNLVALVCPRACGKCGGNAAAREAAAAAAAAAAASVTGAGRVEYDKRGVKKPAGPRAHPWWPCEDEHERCREWADDRECENNAEWMGRHCGFTCGRCVKEGEGWSSAIKRAVATGAPLQLLRGIEQDDGEERAAAAAEGMAPGQAEEAEAERRRKAEADRAEQRRRAGLAREDGGRAAVVGRPRDGDAGCDGEGMSKAASGGGDCRLGLVSAPVPGCRDLDEEGGGGGDGKEGGGGGGGGGGDASAGGGGGGCAAWAARGECVRNAAFMSRRCAASCGQCWAYRTRGGGALRDLRLGWAWRSKAEGGGGGAGRAGAGGEDDHEGGGGGGGRGGGGGGGPLLPTIGFGTAGLGGDGGTRRAVRQALGLGYRMVDTACAREWYRQDEVGEAVKEAAAAAAGAAAGGGEDAGTPKPKLAARTTTGPPPFLVTKIHPADLGYNATLAAARAALSELGADRLGLLLLHYPRCWEGVEGCRGRLPPASLPGDALLWKESWRALARLRAEGKARAIGVSNFSLDEFRELLELAGQHEPPVPEPRLAADEDNIWGDLETPAPEGAARRAAAAAARAARQAARGDGAAERGRRRRPDDPLAVDAVEVRLDPFDASTAGVVREALERGVAVIAYSTLGTQYRDGDKAAQAAQAAQAAAAGEAASGAPVEAGGGGARGGGGGGVGGARGGDGDGAAAAVAATAAENDPRPTRSRANRVLASSVLAGVGEAVGRSPAQVALRWALQRGAAVIPASRSAGHAAENLEALDFSLTDEHMDAIDALPYTEALALEGGGGGGTEEAAAASEQEEAAAADEEEGDDKAAAADEGDDKAAAADEGDDKAAADETVEEKGDDMAAADDETGPEEVAGDKAAAAAA